MGKPLMIQEKDDDRIESLKRRLGFPTKVGVVRAGIDLLEQQAERAEKIKSWKRVATLVAKSSQKVNAEFRPHSRMKRI